MINATIDRQEVKTTFTLCNGSTGYSVLDALAQHDWELVATYNDRPGLLTMKGEDASWWAGDKSATRQTHWVDFREFNKLEEFAPLLGHGGATLSWQVNHNGTMLNMKVGVLSTSYITTAWFRVTREQLEELCNRVGINLQTKINQAVAEYLTYKATSW